MLKETTATIEDVATLLADMVAIPSINPSLLRPTDPASWGGEKRMALFVLDWLRNNGIDAEFNEVMPGRPNVVARLAGPPGSPKMIWEGHLDTVQVEGMDAPFEPVVVDGRLHGRGAVDDKASLAMFMLALRSARNLRRTCDVTFVAAIDEEVTFEGVSHHIANNGRYDMGIAGEPTDLRIVTACKGCVRWEIEIQGRNAHSSRPEEGIDAIAIAADLLVYLREHLRGDRRSHPMLGSRTLTCTLLKAGEGPNSVPAFAKLVFDMRTLPDQSGNQAWSEISETVARFPAPDGAVVTMRPPFIDSISMEVPADAEIVLRLGSALRAADMDAGPIGVAFGSDATKFTRAGTPTVVFGPGSIEQAHATDEFVELTQVARAAEILVEMITEDRRPQRRRP